MHAYLLYRCNHVLFRFFLTYLHQIFRKAVGRVLLQIRIGHQNLNEIKGNAARIDQTSGRIFDFGNQLSKNLIS